MVVNDHALVNGNFAVPALRRRSTGLAAAMPAPGRAWPGKGRLPQQPANVRL